MANITGYSKSVNLVISLCLSYTLLVACVRIWIRKAAFGVDDSIIAFATFITMVHTGADYAAVANGLGSPWRTVVQVDNIGTLNAVSITGVVTFVVGLYLSKCAMISFLGRVTKTHAQNHIYLYCNALITAVGIISVLVVAVGGSMDSGYYWAFHYNTPTGLTQAIRWQALTALDIITEVLLLILPVQLVWGLQMRFQKKATIVAAFYLRLPVIGLSLGRNYYTLKLRQQSDDPGLTSGIVVIWLEIQLAYALAISTISAAKPFAESFNSGFGLAFTRGKSEGSYGLSNVSGKTGTGLSDTEKSRRSSVPVTTLGASEARSAPNGSNGKSTEVRLSTVGAKSTMCEEPLVLRPEIGLKSVTSISADPNPVSWPDNVSDHTSANSMVILRETGYEIHHDEAPILEDRCCDTTPPDDRF